MSTMTETFSLNNLDVFKRPGVKSVEKRDDRFHAGCWIKFDNGWVLSVQWGNGNYGSNYDAELDSKPKDSTTAEIAVWRDDGNHDMVSWGTDEWGDNVQGYCSMERVQHIIGLLVEDKLIQTYQPPTPPPEQRAIDGWTES